MTPKFDQLILEADEQMPSLGDKYNSIFDGIEPTNRQKYRNELYQKVLNEIKLITNNFTMSKTELNDLVELSSNTESPVWSKHESILRDFLKNRLIQWYIKMQDENIKENSKSVETIKKSPFYMINSLIRGLLIKPDSEENKKFKAMVINVFYNQLISIGAKENNNESMFVKKQEISKTNLYLYLNYLIKQAGKEGDYDKALEHSKDLAKLIKDMSPEDLEKVKKQSEYYKGEYKIR